MTIFKGLGAGALAAVTVMSGLTFGPTSATAAPTASTSTTTSSTPASGTKFTFIWEESPDKFWALDQDDLSAHAYDTRQQAEAASSWTLTTTTVGYSFYATVDAGKHKGKCLYDLAWQGGRVITTSGPACGDPLTLFSIDSEGRIVSDSSKHYLSVAPLKDGSSFYPQLSLTGTAAKLESVNPALAAKVDSVSVAARRADISGTARPASIVVIDRGQEARVGADGKWRAILRNLRVGANTVHLENRVDGTIVAEKDLTVNLEVAALSGTASATSTVTDEVTIAGIGEKDVDITITDADGTIVATPTTSAVSGRYSARVPAPNRGGSHRFRVTQWIGGLSAGSVSVRYTYGAAVTITSPVDDLVHPGGALDFTGRGEPLAQVKVQEEGQTGILKSGQVLSSGSWNLRDVQLSADKHTLIVTQTGKGNNVTTAKVTLNPDGTVDPGPGDIAAPTVESPGNNSTVTTSRPVFTGHGHPDASVKIGYGPNSTIGTATVDADGDWTANLTSGLALGRSTLIVTQTSGKDTQTLTHVVNRVAAEAPFRVTSHTNNQNYAEGMTTFRGTAAVGATIRAVNQWGTVMGTDTADGTGNWAFNRNLGPTTAGYDITFTATKDGKTETTQLHLNYQGVIAFQVTSPTNNSTYEVGNTTFRGKASPNTVITAVNQWNTPMGTATANLDGDWAFNRYLGPTTAGYDIRFTATKGTDVQHSTLHISQAVTNVPVEVTSIADGATYTPGLNILRGTGTPNATITAVNAKNGWNVAMGTTKVTADGTWALPERNWGPSNDYEIKVTQTNPDKTTSTTMVNIFAPVFKDLEVTGVTTGAENGPGGVFATFTGTATPGAKVTIKSATTGTAYQTVDVNPQGQWTATRTWNATHTYNLIFDQVAKDGKTDSVTYGVWTPVTP